MHLTAPEHSENVITVRCKNALRQAVNGKRLNGNQQSHTMDNNRWIKQFLSYNSFWDQEISSRKLLTKIRFCELFTKIYLKAFQHNRWSLGHGYISDS